MGMVIQHNLLSQFALDKQKESNNKLKKAAERLSSGYRINRASDDAAGLAVSEKLRSIKRGLRQGLRNIDDGINYVRTVEGASQEIHNMLHRLQELAVESANGPYSEVDRDALDLEYQQLIDEIDQITDNADFNGLPLFEKHLSAFEMNEGDVVHNGSIRINGKNDILTVGYTIDGVQKQCTVNIPHGTYTAEETADLIDDVLYKQAPELIIGVNEQRQFTMQTEGGSIDNISGSASSLFYDTVIGSADGHLLGVTVFRDETVELSILAGENDTISFRVGNTDDTLHSITLDAGRYNRSELIDEINSKLAAAGVPGDVKALPAENDNGKLIIGLASKETITGLAGNFIKMDGITSPIYDICKYGYIDNTQATLSGTKKIANDLVIQRGRNEYFVLDFKYYGDDASAQTAKLRIDLLDPSENTKTYTTPNDLVTEIRSQIDAAGLPFTVGLNSRGGLQFTSEQYGNKCSVKLDTSDVPSSRMVYDLFDAATLDKVVPARATSQYTRAIFTANKKITAPVYIPATENTLTFDITLSDDNGSTASYRNTKTIDVVIPAGSYTSTSDLVQAMNDYLDNNHADVADKLQFSIDASNTIKLYAEGTKGSEVEKIVIDPACSAYDRLIAGTRYDDNYDGEDGYEEVYISSSDNVGGGGGGGSSKPNVTSTNGSTQQGTTSVNQQLGTSQQSGNYLTYYGANTNKQNGETIYDETEGIVGGELIGKKPAKLTLYNVLSQFKADGASLRDIAFSLDIEDDKGVKSYSVSIPKGTTAADAVRIINDSIQDKATAKASGSDLIITTLHEGEEAKIHNEGGSLINWASKSSLASNKNAVVDKTNNKVYVPATLTVPNALSRIPYTADGSNDTLILNAGQHRYNLKLTHKTYATLQEMADEINTLITAADGGTPATTVAVGSNGKSLIFTGPLKESGSVSIDSASSCPIGLTLQTISPTTPNYNPATGNVENPATIRAEGIDTHFPKTITPANNTITMDYTKPDPTDSTRTITEALTITIPDGTYTNGTDFVNAINGAIAADPNLNGKITASYASSGSNKGLTFKTVNGGKGYKITNLGGTSEVNKYISKADTTGGQVDAAANVVRYPAWLNNDRYGTLFNGDGVEINDSNDHCALLIDGTRYEFDIAHGVYQGTTGRADLTDQLRTALAGADVTVTGGSTLEIETNQGGNGKSIRILAENTSPYFKEAFSVAAPTSSSRQEAPCYIIGRNSISNIDIKDYFNKMSFDFTQDGTTYQVDVTVATGNYTAQTLAQAIQDSINQTLPANSLEVYVNSSNKIGIRSATILPLRTISNFSGGLFEEVFQNSSYYNVTRHTEKAGTSTGSYLTYIVGRNNLDAETDDEIKSGQNVIIYPALNDKLVFDLKYDGEPYKVEITIPAGTYTPKYLAQAIQTAGRNVMNNMVDKNGKQFPQDAFRATIGLSALGLPEPDTAIRSADKLVLSFKAPDDGTLDDTECIIDGVRGSAAYRIFYEATQSPTPSKVIGKADLSNGIMIESGINDTLSYTLDGTEYSVTIPEGTYTCDQLYEYLNAQYEQQGSMVRCTNMDGHLMFYTIENGNYDIDRFMGNAADDLFYGGESRESDSEIGIHTGRRTDTYIWYLKTRVDDHLMRINTTGVTTQKRAIKAMERLEYAVNYLSKWRALSGANENRSRHTYARNQEYVENLEEAESTIRDADIPQEVAELAKQQILIQAQNAMLQQSKQQASSILDVMA